MTVNANHRPVTATADDEERNERPLSLLHNEAAVEAVYNVLAAETSIPRSIIETTSSIIEEGSFTATLPGLPNLPLPPPPRLDRPHSIPVQELLWQRYGERHQVHGSWHPQQRQLPVPPATPAGPPWSTAALSLPPPILPRPCRLPSALVSPVATAAVIAVDHAGNRDYLDGLSLYQIRQHQNRCVMHTVRHLRDT